MADDNDNDDVIVDDEGSITRWIPTLVVGIAFGGFIGLAWYAYHSGSQSTKEEDLAVVEADATPMKEKPLDPGGMKFPNQDKTIFETFSGAQTPPKVERVMPAPEEPMARNMDTSDTQTWINDKLKEPAPAADAKVNAPASSAVTEIPKANVKDVAPAAGTSAPIAPVAEAKDIVTHVAKPTETKPVEAKPEVKVDAPKPIAKAEPKAAPAKSTSGTGKVQLGAYTSEEEARNAWERIKKKFPELSDKTVYVVKADLGAKGVYYRLRAGGIADVKAFCAKLTAKGQACIPAT